MKTAYVEVNSEGRILRGMKHVSSIQSGFTFLIVHGYFSSNKIGPHRLYVNLADMLSEKYGDSYRFDLSGMGESDGDITQTRLETHVVDLVNILDYILSKGTKNIIIISHCIGCNLVLEVLKLNKYKFREIVFLAPYFTNDEILKLFFKQPNQLEELYKKGYTFRNGLYSDRSFFLEQSFFDNFLMSINNSNSFINIVAAENDQFIPYRCNELLRTNARNINFIYIKNSDHNFLTTRKELENTLMIIVEDNLYT